MPTNNHPRGDQGVFQVLLRPNTFNQSTFDAVINRQGQLVRWIKARPCPVRTESSHHDMLCNICHGRGEIYEYQRKFWVYQELSPHGDKNNLSCAENIVAPWKTPICKVGRVMRWLSDAQGGITEYKVVSFNDTKIVIGLKDPEDCYPESWESLYVDYAIDLWEIHEQEFTSDGKSIIFETDMELKNQNILLTNNQEIYPVITEIISIKDEKGNSIDHHSFINRTIYLKEPLLKGKKFTAKVYYQEPITIVIEPMDMKTSRELKFDNYEEGDMKGIMSEGWSIGKGDLITSLGTRNRREELITRQNLDFDVLPYFDIFGLASDDIYDNKGNKYKAGEDFELFDYNKVRWVGKQPNAGVIYSISFFELVTYRVVDDKAQLNANENKRLPKHVHLRKLDRLQKGIVQPGLKKEERPVGDWTSQYGGSD